MKFLKFLLSMTSYGDTAARIAKTNEEIAAIKAQCETLQLKLGEFNSEGENLGRRKNDAKSQVRDFMDCKSSN